MPRARDRYQDDLRISVTGRQTRRVSSIDTAFVDDLLGKLLFKEVKGEKVERRTTVNHAMKTARTAWNAVSRANPSVFPPKNPFEKMGLQSNSRETPGGVAELVGIEGGVVSGVINLESSGVEA